MPKSYKPKREHMPPDVTAAIKGIEQFEQLKEQEKYIKTPFSKELLTHLDDNNPRLLKSIKKTHPVVFYRDISINGINDFMALLYKAAQQKEDQKIFSALIEKLKLVIDIAERNTIGSETLTSLKQLQKSLSPETLQQQKKPTTASPDYKRRKL